MRVLHVREACSSLLTLRYYLRFLQDEYARDIGSSGVKRAMRTLMEVPQIMAVTASVQGVTPQMIRLQKINQALAADERIGLRHLVREFC